jgi:hypothetical protein
MELHFKTPIDGAYDAIEAALHRGAESWLPEADLKDDELTAELTFDPAGKHIRRRVRVIVGSVQRFGYGVTVHLQWEAAEHPQLYPRFEGVLRLEQLDSGGCQLRLDGHYRPPGGEFGAALDRALMNRVARSTVLDFFEKTTALLTPSTGDQGTVPPGVSTPEAEDRS